MTARSLHTVLAALLVACAGACGPQSPTERVGAQSSAEVIPPGRGWSLWGIGLNGRSLDGQDLANRGLVGVSLHGVQMGRRTGSAALDGSALRAAGGGGLAGRDLVGATFIGMLDDSGAISLRIDAAYADSDPHNADVHQYAVSFETASGYLPLCGVDATGTAVRAIPLAGRWDYRTGVAGGGDHMADPDAFTFACEGYVLAKCVELGYKPWDSIRACSGGHGRCPVISLADLHQTCTRAFRADYCGDGTSYTVDGTLIDVYDAYGYRTSQPGWPFEAEWTTSGARCAARLRVPSQGTPSCWANLQSATCGASADFSAALLMNQDSP